MGRNQFVAAAWVILASVGPCGALDTQAQTKADTLPTTTRTRCDAAADHPTLGALIGRMNQLPTRLAPVWNDYRPDEQTYLFVVDAADGVSCGIVWRQGLVRATLELAGKPRLATPMFGFHVSGVADSAQGAALWTQPAAVAQQLTANQITRAVLIPVVPAIRLPFELTDLHLFDMAVHEAFHLNVQAPSWLDVSGPYQWPAWDRRAPNRRELVARCYAGAEAAAERDMLVDAAMSALTKGTDAAVCTGARRFAEARRVRWASQAGARVPVDGSPGEPPPAVMSCEEAESVMELREGVPDFVFWITAFEGDIVSRERLAQRFRAKQQELFYLTGAMQLAILRRLTDPFSEVTGRMAASQSWRTGSVFARFETEIERRCR